MNALTYHDSSWYFFVTKQLSLNLNCLLRYLTDDTESRDTNKIALAELNHIYSSKSSRSFLFCLSLFFFLHRTFKCRSQQNTVRKMYQDVQIEPSITFFSLFSLSLSLNLLIYFIIQVQMVVGLALLHESCAPNPIKCLIPKMSTTQVVAHFNSLLVSNAYALMDTFKKNH